MPRQATLAIVLILLASGCAAPGDEPEPTGTDPTDPGPRSPGEPPRSGAIDSNPVDLNGFDLTDCHIIEARHQVAPTMVSWPRPTSWPPSNYPSLDYFYLECERIAWGLHEKGPLRLVIEAEWLTGEMQQCTPPGIHHFFLINKVYVDGAEEVRLWRDELGWPAEAASISFQESLLGPVTEQTVTWEVIKGSPSQFVTRFLDDGDNQVDENWRWLWFNDTAMNAIDLATSFPYTSTGLTVTTARYEEPSPLAAEPSVDRPVFGYMYRDLNATGGVSTWDNHECSP